ncbi:MAG: carbonic anhydrase [Betaproteobacteria bacterium]|nr:carbonic anhydrase [Betaproteobacteria bacterium]
MTSPKQLLQGFLRFREQHFVHNDALYRQLVEQGQTPNTLVVACCDARVDPSLVLDCAPGDLFVIRNVANLVPPAENQGQYHGTSAALEFGVRNLGVQHIIVLGHAHCGGIRSLMETGGINNPDSFIDDWMHLVEDARAGVAQDMPGAPLEDQARACEQRAILISLHNLMTFPWVRKRVEDGSLFLHGWYFDIEHGQLLRYDAAAHAFEAL